MVVDGALPPHVLPRLPLRLQDIERHRHILSCFGATFAVFPWKICACRAYRALCGSARFLKLCTCSTIERLAFRLIPIIYNQTREIHGFRPIWPNYRLSSRLKDTILDPRPARSRCDSLLSNSLRAELREGTSLRGFGLRCLSLLTLNSA